MRIGVIGLGNIGNPIASNLIEDGHQVFVYDTDKARAEPLVRSGAVRADGPGEIAARSEITFTSLPSPAAIQSVAEAWLEGAPPDTVLVDLSTNAPETVRQIGASLTHAGRYFLEAPLTGGAPGAKARALVFMVGGDEAVYARCEPVLQKLGRATFHLGPLGLGNTAKLVNSLLAFSSAWVSLEGLALAAKAGIDLRTMVEVIRIGGAGNFFTDRMVEGINQRGRPTQFSLALAAKDAGLLLDVARESAVPMPVAAEIAQVFVAALGAGLGERDWSDLVELIERQANVKLELPPPRTQAD
ncbi:MAG: NAD(P)-dependent oxidoreductase [Myxococcales bacterium]|nr:NAD(P)-dependent oxidoreductase [Myxococcales bacterium]MCZ6712768.1 NAD(P)-dependent oxidoreductase [Deltaproteobacteria bacterium]TDJ07965.1 MAG: NAD(P)-dependent oxidoreductase [Deltaproteobacteria bacterium]